MELDFDSMIGFLDFFKTSASLWRISWGAE